MSAIDLHEIINQDEIPHHILVRAWLNQETGRDEPDHCLSKVAADNRRKAEEALQEEGLIDFNEGRLALSDAGAGVAKNLIRRNRLAERLFAVVFNLSEEAVRTQACRMEHEKVLTPEAVEGICAFLGHPPTCPHGRPIPPGDCCRLFVQDVKPLVTPLSQGEAGESYRIVFMAPKYHDLLEQLSGLGVVPGVHCFLARKLPAYVLKVGQTEVAIERSVADGIYVLRCEAETQN